MLDSTMFLKHHMVLPRNTRVTRVRRIRAARQGRVADYLAHRLSLALAKTLPTYPTHSRTNTLSRLNQQTGSGPRQWSPRGFAQEQWDSSCRGARFCSPGLDRTSRFCCSIGIAVRYQLCVILCRIEGVRLRLRSPEGRCKER